MRDTLKNKAAPAHVVQQPCSTFRFDNGFCKLTDISGYLYQEFVGGHGDDSPCYLIRHIKI